MLGPVLNLQQIMIFLLLQLKHKPRQGICEPQINWRRWMHVVICGLARVGANLMRSYVSLGKEGHSFASFDLIINFATEIRLHSRVNLAWYSEEFVGRKHLIGHFNVKPVPICIDKHGDNHQECSKPLGLLCIGFFIWQLHLHHFRLQNHEMRYPIYYNRTQYMTSWSHDDSTKDSPKVECWYVWLL